MQSISPGAVVDRIWELYRDQFVVLFTTAVVLYAIQFVLALVLPSVLSIVLVLLFWALSILYQGMVVQLVQDVQDGRRDHSVGQLLRSVEPVFWPLVAVSILFGLGVAIGFILLIIPGLVLIVIWSVVAPVTVLEHPGVTSAFGRSRELVRGNGWNVFGVIVIVFVVVFVISIVVGLAASGLGSVGRALVQWAVNSALAPVTALSASVIYFALRGTHGEPTTSVSTPPTGQPPTTPPPTTGPPTAGTPTAEPPPTQPPATEPPPTQPSSTESPPTQPLSGEPPPTRPPTAEP